MNDSGDKATFSVQGKDYVFQEVRGRLKDLEVLGKELQLVLETDSGDVTCRAPWYAEVKNGHSLAGLTGQAADDPDEHTVYYLYDHDTQSIEVNTRFKKPNKTFPYALLDFGLVLLFGVLLAPMIAPLLQDNKMLGFLSMVGLVLGIYVVVYLVTYRMIFRRDLNEIQKINAFIKRRAESLAPG
jgi:uncharacterized membrane protein